MAFIGTDGFVAPVTRKVLSTDTYVQLPAATADRLATMLPAGSFTLLVLEDGVCMEIVRVDAGFAGITSGGFTDVPVTRGKEGTTTLYNMPASCTRLCYRLTTPGVQYIVAQAIASA